jgi:ubiquinol-cytochrome c reductase cytochrome c subunit
MTAPPDTPAGRPGRRRGPAAWLRAPRASQSRLRRRLGTGVRLTAALLLAGGIYTAFAPASQAEDTPQLSRAAQEGQSLFNESCISCHGRNAQGVQGRGPSLIGVGAAAVEFQVSTGRMPMARQEAQAARKAPQFNADQTRQLAAYIQELGGGPQLPSGDNYAKNGDVARGGALFRINCSSCHAFSANGGALASGGYAPPLYPATQRQIYAAMLTGPQNMPVFGDNELSPQDKADIIAYIENLKNDRDPGGYGLGRYGPVPEALVIFLVGMVGIIFTTLWIAGKS